jgi:hypothetical protein
MDSRKVALGGLLLFVSSLTVIETGLVALRAPLYLAAAASLALAIGSLLTDIRQQDRPV